eukprot:2823116-Rhodomonas_salina.1
MFSIAAQTGSNHTKDLGFQPHTSFNKLERVLRLLVVGRAPGGGTQPSAAVLQPARSRSLLRLGLRRRSNRNFRTS